MTKNLPPGPQPISLLQPVRVIPGVGIERATQLGRLGVVTVRDLLLLRPRRHEDRRQLCRMADLVLGTTAIVRGKVAALGVKSWKKKTRSVFELILDDGSARLHCRWWNLPYMQNYFKNGDEVFIYGKVSGLKPRTMDHPETEVIEGTEENQVHLNRVAPIYPLTEGLPQRWLRSLLFRTLPLGIPLIEAEGKELPGFPSAGAALKMLHFPESLGEVEVARQRFALEELLLMQRELFRRRAALRSKSQAIHAGGDQNRHIRPFLKSLGFQLNQAQARVLRTIRQDMSGQGEPMRRLLQGDVGSGKTVVAACAALMALESGWSVLLMAPTEILAEQHFQNFQRWFSPLRIPVRLRTGMHRPAGKSETSEKNHPQLGLETVPAPEMVLGTHALLEENVQLSRLGLVIIDEQHKFGVAQRESLLKKGQYPHLLVMTATPIPRTLGLTIYGDLDISVIDQLPEGRGEIQTAVRSRAQQEKIWEFVEKKLGMGQQAYVVYPRVEDTGGEALRSVLSEFKQLEKRFSGFRVGLLHGRLRSEEKERVMEEFRLGEVQLLVATTVIEVGLDVPNATVMVIDHADSFGLSQLHQLRGRIGRGAAKSFCLLVADPKTEEARQRLRVMEQTRDGFVIAETDLILRGAGELLGRQQSGSSRLKFADLLRDGSLIDQARGLIQAQNGENLM